MQWTCSGPGKAAADVYARAWLVVADIEMDGMGRKEDEELSGAPAVPSPDSSLTSNRCPTHPLFVQCVPDFCRGLNPHGRSNRRVI